MMSDTLFEAIEEIEYYQAQMPDIYGDLAQDIESVKGAMRQLQRQLDTPPSYLSEAGSPLKAARI